MYEVKYSDLKIRLVISVIGIIIGLSLLYTFAIEPIKMYLDNKKIDSEIMSSRVEIIEKNHKNGYISYSKKYYYTVNGKDYSCNPNLNTNNMPKNDNEIVYYYSKNPKVCKTRFKEPFLNVVSMSYSFMIIFMTLICIYDMVFIINEIKRVKKLSKNAKLVKRIPYRKKVFFGYRSSSKYLIIDYTLPNGNTIELEKNISIFSFAKTQKYNYVDLLIDENNTKNYYIDFEINRISGNLDSDYYNNIKE